MREQETLPNHLDTESRGLCLSSPRIRRDSEMNPGALQAAPEIVRLTGPRGLCVHGVLTGISAGAAHIVSAVPIASGTDVEVQTTRCAPFTGQVMYSRHLHGCYRIAVFFKMDPMPPVKIGARPWIDLLRPCRALGRGSIVDCTANSVSFAWPCAKSRQLVELGAWVRMELDESVLFGEVISVVPIGDSVMSVGIYVDAMLPKADLSARVAGAQ